MTTKTSTIHEGILKNVGSEHPSTAAALTDAIKAEANRREHLNGAVVEATWDRAFGISIQVKDAGHRQHLANAIHLPPDVVVDRIEKTRSLKGEARVGTFLGYRVTIWNVEA